MPHDHPHDALAERFLSRVPHVRELGIEMVSVSSARIHIRLPYRDDWLGDTTYGLIHPGVTSTLIDSGCGLAVLARLEKPEPIATLDLRMDYLRPGVRGKALECQAECYRVTTHIVFARATVWQDSIEKPIALSQSAFMRSSTSKKRVI